LSPSSDFSTTLSSFWLASGARFAGFFGAAAFFAVAVFAGALRFGAVTGDFAREVRVVRLAVRGALLVLLG
jgi:hypothetical protein